MDSPVKALLRDLDAVLPAHADLDPGNGPEVVGRHLGARLRAARCCHPAAPVPATLVLHRGHLGLRPADLQLLARPDDRERTNVNEHAHERILKLEFLRPKTHDYEHTRVP